MAAGIPLSPQQHHRLQLRKEIAELLSQHQHKAGSVPIDQHRNQRAR